MRSSTQQSAASSYPQLAPRPADRIREKSRHRGRYQVIAASVAADTASVFAGTAAAVFGWEIFRGHRFPNHGMLILSVGLQYSLLFVLLAQAYYLYDYAPSLLQIRDTANVIRISVFSLIAIAVSVFYSHQPRSERNASRDYLRCGPGGTSPVFLPEQLTAPGCDSSRVRGRSRRRPKTQDLSARLLVPPQRTGGRRNVDR
jgi:hypothetical protein